MTFNSFVGDVENQRQIREQEERYQRLIQRLSKDNYDFTQIEPLLETNPEETLGALYWATRQGELQLETNPGREVWRRVRQYYHRTDQRDMLPIVARGVYKATTSDWRQYVLESFMNLKGVFLAVQTLGYIPTAPQIKAGLDKVYERYANKRLGPI